MNRNRLFSPASLTIMAMMIALLSASSYVSIPLPFTSARITATTMVVNIIGLLLTPAQALTVSLGWFLIGLFGVPVFSGGIAGPAKLFSAGGGYFIGFIVNAFLISLFSGKVRNMKARLAFLIVIGIPVVYLFGAAWMKLVTGQPWPAVILQSVLPFIPLDIVKCVAAVIVAKALSATGLFAGGR